MAFKTVTVTPSIAAGTYSLNDVLFNPTKLKLPARGAKLISAYAVDTEGQLNGDAVQLYFFQKNTNDLGTQNATANISDANFRANQYIGGVHISSTAVSNAALDNLNIKFGDTYADVTESSPLPLAVPLSSIESGGAIYVAGILDSVSTEPNFSGADSVDLVFGFEY
tara:strand:+ start:1626 stop:2126 length:501 start_codon:yes stop_codon:yes gene_type:complete